MQTQLDENKTVKTCARLSCPW